MYYVVFTLNILSINNEIVYLNPRALTMIKLYFMYLLIIPIEPVYNI